MQTKREKTSLRDRLGALPWWAVLLAGLAAAALGVTLLVSPANASETFARAIGVLAVIGGFATITSLLFVRVNWGWKLFGGLLAMVVGFLVAARPLGSAYFLSALVLWLLATAIILLGIVLIIQGIAYAGWGHTILGILALIFGGLLIFSVAVGSLVMPWLFGLLGVVGGIVVVVDAFRIRGRQRAEASAALPGGPASATK